MCRVLLHEFGVVQAHRTSSNLLEPPHCRYRAKCVEFCNMGSGWFDCTEPPLATYLEEKQGVQGAFAHLASPLKMAAVPGYSPTVTFSAFLLLINLF